MTKTNNLTLSLKASEIDSNEKSYAIEATDDEKSILVERFNLVSLSAFSAEVTVKSKADMDAVLLEGHIDAELEQACTISLKPVAETVSENFSLLLVSPEMANSMDEDEAYLDVDAPDYDALEGDIVEVGELVAQTLAISMNQYPRAEGVELNVSASANVSVNEVELEKPNPFAALGKLKDQS
ncbi:YceD family protein [Kordiimonas laminariae]|uniref:YceD family protein n=1 Tax=Kordiimonas laminariae TaxID=2917717 RepID=UPI001FF65F8C|nr:DUF177 domain-containing protein [Kordiimonas laminariae]MCK0070399.1 DUF177 domain-containing protein [Kordiimonas laminariae]